MSIRTSPWPKGTPCWIDLTTPDIAAARSAYGAAVGWQFAEFGENYGGYVMCSIDGHDAGGIGPTQDGSVPSWTVYFASDDIEATATAIRENGGQVVMGPHDVADMGKMLIAVDPGGAVFGSWQHVTHIGSSLVNQPGGLIWEECDVADPDAVKSFYETVFGLTFAEMEMEGEKYTIFSGSDGTPMGGMDKVASGGGPHWLAYIAVEDCDKAVEAMTAAGSKVESGPEDMPWGRSATITDPWGARIAFIAATGEGTPDRSG